jgi:hypothetical protein
MSSTTRRTQRALAPRAAFGTVPNAATNVMSAFAPSGARSGGRQAHHAAQVREPAQAHRATCRRQTSGVGAPAVSGSESVIWYLTQLGGRVGCRAGHERPVE